LRALRFGDRAFRALTFRLAILVLLAIAPAVGAQLYNQARLRDAREAEVRLVAHRYAELVSDRLDGVFDNARTLLLAVSELPAARRLEAAECSRFVTELESLYGGLYGVSVADAEGRLFCAPAGSPEPQSISDRPYFARALAARDIAVGDAAVGRVSGKLMVPLARRIDADGAPVAVALVTLRFDRVTELLGQLSFPPGMSISILDRRGTILVRTPDTHLVGQDTPPPFRWMLEAKRGGTFDSSERTASDGVARLIGFVAPPENAAGVAVAVGLPRQGALADLQAAEWREVATLAMGALAGLALALLLARRWVARPIDELAAAADRVRRGDLRARAELTGASGELNRLADAFNAMAAALEARHADRERLAAIVESSEDAIYSRSLAGDVLTWNGGAERLLGWSAAEIVGRPAELTIPPERADELRSLMERVRRGDSTSIADTERLHSDGRRIGVSVQVSPIRGPDGAVAAASVIVRSIAEHKHAMERQNILLAELDHRVKNALAVVQSLIYQSLAATPERAALLGRLTALASAHGMLSESRWRGAALGALLQRELAPYGAARCVLSGAAVELAPKATQTFALVLHELATNSAKYGALSSPSGSVEVTWSLASGGLDVDWRERGGPPVERPTRRGFGLRSIDAVLRHDLDGETEVLFERDGLRCRIHVPAAALTDGLPPPSASALQS